MAGVIAEVGRRAAFDARFHLRSAAPYSPALLDEWARQVTAVSRAWGTRFHKALVLDCDNTLWGGVVGEDLVAGVKLGAHAYPGNVFHRAQAEFQALQRQGVLLCLASKNEPADVAAMFETHPEMVLKREDIIVSEVSWSDKPASLQRIAETLNIGLDALVFLDDFRVRVRGGEEPAAAGDRLPGPGAAVRLSGGDRPHQGPVPGRRRLHGWAPRRPRSTGSAPRRWPSRGASRARKSISPRSA